MGSSRKLVAGLALLVTAGGCASGESTDTPEGTTVIAPAATTSEVSSATTEAVAGATPRCYSVAADATGEVGVLLFGGWQNPEAGGPWESLQAFHPERGWEHLPTETMPGPGDVFAYHGQSDQAVFLEVGGGTWTFDPTGRGWTDRLPEAPPAHGARMVYDSESDRLIAFGGDNFEGPLFDDTWAYDAETNTWTQMTPATSPSPRSYFAMAYDPSADRVILFGGSNLADTWAYDYNTDAWTELTPPQSPSPRDYSAMTYDPVGNRIILFGGVTGPDEEPLGDTWSFDYEAATWTQVSSAGPTPRGWHVLVTDMETNTLVLFGGGASRAMCTSETWLFDSGPDTWSPAP